MYINNNLINSTIIACFSKTKYIASMQSHKSQKQCILFVFIENSVSKLHQISDMVQLSSVNIYIITQIYIFLCTRYHYLNALWKSKLLYIFLTQIKFCLPEIFKTNDSNCFLSTKLPYEFGCWEFTKFICSQKFGVKWSY